MLAADREKGKYKVACKLVLASIIIYNMHVLGIEEINQSSTNVGATTAS